LNAQRDGSKTGLNVIIFIGTQWIITSSDRLGMQESKEFNLII